MDDKPSFVWSIGCKLTSDETVTGFGSTLLLPTSEYCCRICTVPGWFHRVFGAGDRGGKCSLWSGGGNEGGWYERTGKNKGLLAACANSKGFVWY